MSRILLIDDDIVQFDPDSADGKPTANIGPLGLFINALERSGHTIERITGPGSALGLGNQLNQFDLAIVDVMMPPEPATSKFADMFDEEATSFGLGTGFILVEELRKVAPGLPIVLFSNIVSFGGINSGTIEQLVKDGVVAKAISKIDVTPFQFVQLINEVLQ